MKESNGNLRQRIKKTANILVNNEEKEQNLERGRRKGHKNLGQGMKEWNGLSHRQTRKEKTTRSCQTCELHEGTEKYQADVTK